MKRNLRIALFGLEIVPENTRSMFSGIYKFVSEQAIPWSFVYCSEESSIVLKHIDIVPWDGAIVRITDRRVSRAICNFGQPAINISACLEEPGIPSVRRDDWTAGRSAAEFLLSKGLTQFALVRCAGSGWYHAARTQGFVEALARQNLRPKIFAARGPLEGAERDRLGRWLGQFDTPVGLFISDDYIAQDVIDLCNSAGLEVPRDIAIIGSVNLPEIVKHTNPSLSCVQPDEFEIGYKAAAHLALLMSGKRSIPDCLYVPPLPVAERESTEIFPIEDIEMRKAVQFIHDRSTTLLSVDDIADNLGLSRATFYRRFSTATGKTPHEYINFFRLEKAREMLSAQQALPLDEIARACGYSGVKHFKASYVKRWGVPPQQHRNQDG